MPRGGFREAARGKTGPKRKFRPVLSHQAGLTMTLIAWARYGRPTTDEETAAALEALINEAAAKMAPADVAGE